MDSLDLGCRMRCEGVVRLALAQPQIEVKYATLAAASAGGHEGIVRLLEDFRMQRPCECASLTAIEEMFQLSLSLSS